MIFHNLKYQQKMKEEINHFEKMYKGGVSLPHPSVWKKVEEYFAEYIFKATKVRNLYEYVARHTGGKKKVSILGLGSGSCSNELDGITPLLQQNGCQVELTCMDINESVLKKAENEAKKRKVKFKAVVKDVNKLSLEENIFDVIVAYSSLHHFLKLDYITKQINHGLKEDGIFVTVDIPTRNGYKMWPETYKIVNAIWRVLPPKFKIDHTACAQPKYMDTYENTDHSLNTFECINSEAILPALRKNLFEIVFVPAFPIARRFFDTKFGPNYNLKLPLDKAIFDFIMNLDSYYLEKKILKPETFFGAYRKMF